MAFMLYTSRSVADRLKRGLDIAPEYFDESTVYFSDIVSFTTLASESSPMQIVDLLNDLYSMFDGVIAKFDAYKVSEVYIFANCIKLHQRSKLCKMSQCYREG